MTNTKSKLTALVIALIMVASCLVVITGNAYAATKKTDKTITYTGTTNNITYKVVCTRATGKCKFTFSVKKTSKKDRTIKYKLGTTSNGGDRINTSVKLKKGKKTVTTTKYFDNKGYSKKNKVDNIHWLDGTPCCY